MKVTLRVSLKSSDNRTRTQDVQASFDELTANKAATEAEASRLAVEELEARDSRNGRSATWSATGVTRNR